MKVAQLAQLILSDKCKSITFLTGAGVSVAADIPDFRSPGGMYDTLKPDLITTTERIRQLMKMDPTYVVSWDIFQRTQFPYLEVRRPFILGTRERQWKATIAHRFAELLHMKTNKLTRIYTQNIDGLYQQCDNIPADKIINVHGTLSKARCEGCEESVDFDKFCDDVRSNIKDIYKQDDKAPKESKPILCEHCKMALVKPETVLFGRSLPSKFFECAEKDLPDTDLLIIAGTSLTVSPANSVPVNVPDYTVRVIINREQVGSHLGIEYGPEAGRDWFAKGDCDDVFLDLIEYLGWFDDLEAEIDLLPPKSADLVRQRAAERRSASSSNKKSRIQ